MSPTTTTSSLLISHHHHHQVADKAFEEKTRETLAHYLKKYKFSYRELDRNIMVDKDIIAEWEGVFELENGENLVFGMQALCFNRILLY